MDPMPGEKSNYDQEEESQYKQQGGGAISAPAEDALIGDDDDEYDELYGDLNIKEGFLQPQPSEAPGPNGAVNVAQNGESRLFVGELHWWTTDAEVQSVLSEYGRVKEFKFYDEKRSGRSKGYCEVEFYDSASAAACKEGMHGYNFNGRACTVEFASPQTERQMADAYRNTSQVRPQSQSQPQGRRSLNDNAVIITCRTNDPTGDFGRGRGLPRGSQGGGNWRHGPNWGIGTSTRPNMPNARGSVAGASSGGFMNPHPMMGAGFDSSYMGRGVLCD
nr:PREDICTED: 29 kDa ribonucleoprotein, chloroplastic-like [Daucus carota subsp. sativus]